MGSSGVWVRITPPLRQVDIWVNHFKSPYNQITTDTGPEENNIAEKHNKLEWR